MEKEFIKAMAEIEKIFDSTGVRWITDPGKEREEFYENVYDYLTASNGVYELVGEGPDFEAIPSVEKDRLPLVEMFDVDDATFRVDDISKFKEHTKQIEEVGQLPELVIQKFRFYFEKICGNIELRIICWIDEIDEIRDSGNVLWDVLENQLEEKTNKKQRLERMYNPELKEKYQIQALNSIIEPIKAGLIESEFSKNLEQQITKALGDWEKTKN